MKKKINKYNSKNQWKKSLFILLKKWTWKNHDKKKYFYVYQIFADCVPGFFGVNCENICGKCKSGETCNTVTGLCPDGCESHLMPPNCKGSF